MSRQSGGSNLARRCAAELIGTALLVFGGVGTAVLAPSVGPVGIALAFGLTLLVLAYAIGPVSGAHVNPAVTLGMAISRRLPFVEALGYIVAQVVGGVAGASLVYAVAENRAGYRLSVDGLGTNGWGSHSSGGYAFTAAAIVEVLLTAILVFTVLAATASASTATVAGIPIGIALVVIHLVAIPIDGTSVNPARSIGPALFVGGDALTQLWLFVVAPLVGAVLAAGAFALLSLRPELTAAPGVGDDSTAEPGSRPGMTDAEVAH